GSVRLTTASASRRALADQGAHASSVGAPRLPLQERLAQARGGRAVAARDERFDAKQRRLGAEARLREARGVLIEQLQRAARIATRQRGARALDGFALEGKTVGLRSQRLACVRCGLARRRNGHRLDARGLLGLCLWRGSVLGQGEDLR